MTSMPMLLFYHCKFLDCRILRLSIVQVCADTLCNKEKSSHYRTCSRPRLCHSVTLQTCEHADSNRNRVSYTSDYHKSQRHEDLEVSPPVYARSLLRLGLNSSVPDHVSQSLGRFFSGADDMLEIITKCIRIKLCLDLAPSDGLFRHGESLLPIASEIPPYTCT